MALSFPANPTDGQTYESGGTTWTYEASRSKWIPDTFTASGGGADVQEFNTPGTFTWTKPAGAKLVLAQIWSAGAGGSAGEVKSPSSFSDTTGQSGGGGGGYIEKIFNADELSSTESVVVGAGGAGHPAHIDFTVASGEDGGFSSFSNILVSGGKGNQNFALGGGIVEYASDSNYVPGVFGPGSPKAFDDTTETPTAYSGFGGGSGESSSNQFDSFAKAGGDSVFGGGAGGTGGFHGGSSTVGGYGGVSLSVTSTRAVTGQSSTTPGSGGGGSTAGTSVSNTPITVTSPVSNSRYFTQDALTYLNGYIIATRKRNIFSSSDSGVTWNVATFSNEIGTGTMSSVYGYDGSYYYAVQGGSSYARFYRSGNLTSWSKLALVQDQVDNAFYGNGYHITWDSTAGYYSNNNASTFTSFSLPISPYAGTYDPSSGRLIVVSSNSIAWATTPNGTWTTVSLPTSNFFNINHNGSGTIVASGGNGTAYSTNGGDTWTLIADTDIDTNYYSKLNYTSGLGFIAINQAGNYEITSADGINWTKGLLNKSEWPDNIYPNWKNISNTPGIQLIRETSGRKWVYFQDRPYNKFVGYSDGEGFTLVDSPTFNVQTSASGGNGGPYAGGGASGSINAWSTTDGAGAGGNGGDGLVRITTW